MFRFCSCTWASRENKLGYFFIGSDIQRTMASTDTRFEVEKFNRTGNLGLWQTKMKNMLAQHGCLKALRDVKPVKMDDDGCSKFGSG